MLGRAWLCFSPVKGNCTPQRHTLTRNLRTQCINLYPRGHSRSVIKQISHQEHTHNDEVSVTSKLNHTHHGDTRSIEAIDPVVLKYTNMVNEMRSQLNGVERVNETHFGSIRFDNENVPHIHGLFDAEYGPDNTPIKHATPMLSLKLEERGNGKVIVIKDQESSSYSSDDGNAGLQEYQDRLKVSKEELNTECIRNYDTDSSSSSSEDKVKRHDRAMPKDGFIDNCVFGESLSNSSNSQRLIIQNMESTAASEGDIGGDMKDLNYIDEVFFKNSLENLEINRQPAIAYAEIKKDLENAMLSTDKQHTSEDESDKNLSHVNKRSEQNSKKDKDEINEHSNTADQSETPKSAHDYVIQMRRDQHKKQFGLGQSLGDGSNKSYKKILSLMNVTSLYKSTRYEVLKSLKSSILYDNHDIVGLHKPYGLSMHAGTDSQYHVLTEYLPDLAHFLKAEALYPIHRLDATTTGVVLLARTSAMADTLKSMFKKHKLKKTYWAITKSIPDPVQGIIDIPIAEGTVDGRRRMVLKPDVKGLQTVSSSSKLAVTKFRTISQRDSGALVELCPMSGVKHQLRVHLAFGLSCPVLGDHKYSHLKKMAPQALPGDMLDKLKIKQSKVRDLPLFLHCKSIIVPEIVDGRNIVIRAKIPAYFNKALTLLKLNRHESKVKLDGLVTSLMN